VSRTLKEGTMQSRGGFEETKMEVELGNGSQLRDHTGVVFGKERTGKGEAWGHGVRGSKMGSGGKT